MSYEYFNEKVQRRTSSKRRGKMAGEKKDQEEETFYKCNAKCVCQIPDGKCKVIGLKE